MPYSASAPGVLPPLWSRAAKKPRPVLTFSDWVVFTLPYSGTSPPELAQGDDGGDQRGGPGRTAPIEPHGRMFKRCRSSPVCVSERNLNTETREISPVSGSTWWVPSTPEVRSPLVRKTEARTRKYPFCSATGFRDVRRGTGQIGLICYRTHPEQRPQRGWRRCRPSRCWLSQTPVQAGRGGAERRVQGVIQTLA